MGRCKLEQAADTAISIANLLAQASGSAPPRSGTTHVVREIPTDLPPEDRQVAAAPSQINASGGAAGATVWPTAGKAVANAPKIRILDPGARRGCAPPP